MTPVLTVNCSLCSGCFNSICEYCKSNFQNISVQKINKNENMFLFFWKEDLKEKSYCGLNSSISGYISRIQH